MRARLVFTAILLLGLNGIVVSQDVILKKDNTTIVSKVLEINSTEIKYKKWSNQDGPIYSILRSEVTSINYQNGEVEKFNDNVAPTPTPQQTVAPTPVPQQTVGTNPVTPTPIVQSQPKPQKSPSPYARGRVQFSLNGGLAIPMGDFGKTESNVLCAPFALFGDELETGIGGAKKGFNASFRLHIPVYQQDKDVVGIPLKFNVMYNGISDIEKRLYREFWQYFGNAMNEQNGTNAYQLQVTEYSEYLNYSFMGGVDFTHYFSKSFGLFAEANLGLNIAQITGSNINNLLGGNLTHIDYNNHTEYYSGDGLDLSYKTKVNFAYEVGGGLFLFDHLSVGVFYTGFSPFQVTPVWREYSNNYSDEFGNYEDNSELTAPKLQVSALSLQLGVHF